MRVIQLRSQTVSYDKILPPFTFQIIFPPKFLFGKEKSQAKPELFSKMCNVYTLYPNDKGSCSEFIYHRTYILLNSVHFIGKKWLVYAVK